MSVYNTLFVCNNDYDDDSASGVVVVAKKIGLPFGCVLKTFTKNNHASFFTEKYQHRHHHRYAGYYLHVMYVFLILLLLMLLSATAFPCKCVHWHERNILPASSPKISQDRVWKSQPNIIFSSTRKCICFANKRRKNHCRIFSIMLWRKWWWLFTSDDDSRPDCFLSPNIFYCKQTIHYNAYSQHSTFL